MEEESEMEAPSLKRRPQGISDLETAAKVTRTVDVQQGQEFNGHGSVLQESGYGSSLEISVDESMFSGYPSEVDNIPVEGNHKLCRFAENILHCEITLSQQAAGQRKKEKKKRKKEESNEVLDENKSPQDEIVKKTCALLNSGGGVLKIAILGHQEIPVKKFLQKVDEFWQPFEGKLTDLVKPSTYKDVFDRHLVGSEEILLFINAPQHLCTIRYNLYFAGDARVHETTFGQALELLQKSSNNVDVCLKNLPKLPEAFRFDHNCGFPESEQIQFKHFSGERKILENHGQREKVQKHISAFANTNGGEILVGIEDSGNVLGVDMKKNKQGEIKRQVISMIENMKFPISQERKVHWDIEFIPVMTDCDTTQDLAVVAIKVAGLKSLGGVFMKHPESYELLNHDAIQVIQFDQWKQRMLSGSKLQTVTKATEHLSSMFEKLEISSGVTPVLSIKSQVEEIRDSFFAMQEGFQVTPKGFHENLPKDVQDIIREIKKLSSLHTKSCGLIVASKSLLVNLGGSPSDNVVCDLLVISTGLGGLHLYTVCKEGKEEECLHYSKEVSLLLKTSLVRGGGCPVRFYVSYHITSSSKEVKSPLPDKQYPPSYDLTGRTEDLNLVLKALVIILAKVPSPLSSKLGVTFLCLLTREQFGLVHQQIYVNRELWVKGVAGSGKTLVALEVIKKIRLKEHLENHEILYVAENEGIVEQIRECDVCKAVCRQTFLRSSYPEVRHVILDEAHNYQQPKRGTSWLHKARKIVRQRDRRHPGYLWIFTDEHQLNHNFNTGMPRKDLQKPEFRLKTVIRNSGEVFEHATRHLTRQGGSVEDHPMLGHNFMGEKVSVKPYSSSSTSQLQVLNKTLEELIKEGYGPRDIAVLFSKGDCIPDRPFAGPSYCSAAGNGSDKLVVSTVRKYSGLERPVVVLVDLECSIPEGCNMRAFQYCAQTRAMVKLVIIRCELCKEICRSQRQ